MKEVTVKVKVPNFNVDEFLDKYLVHNDFPDKVQLEEAEKNEQMIVTFLKLPRWLSVFEITPEASKEILEAYLRSNGLKKSHRHVVNLVSCDTDTEELFKIFREDQKEHLAKPSGFTTIGGANVSK